MLLECTLRPETLSRQVASVPEDLEVGGRTPFVVRFGSIRVAIESDRVGADALASYRWQDTDGGPYQCFVSLNSRPNEHRPSSLGLSADIRSYEGIQASGWMMLSQGIAQFRVIPAEHRLTRSDHYLAAMEASLGVAVGWMAARGGLVLHAASVRLGDGAYVICGTSGAGKSTLAARFDRGWLGDEYALLVPDESGVWQCWRTAQRHRRWPEGEPWVLPLRGLFALETERETTRARPANRPDAISSIVASAFWPADWANDELLDLALGMGNAVPVSHLSHCLTAPRQDLIDQLTRQVSSP